MQFDLYNGTQNRILDAKSYPEFKEALANSACSRCELAASRRQIVVDRGNPLAKVLMIGEAPGENEDLQGKAFVGRAGQLLDELLKNLGFDTNCDSLIMNMVKCRPPENRAPKREEVSACRPFLEKQLSLINPKVVLLLGAVAFKHMFPDKKDISMRSEVGKFFEHPGFPGVQLMVLYHPAYILRDPRKKPLMIEHLSRFKTYWDRHCPANA